MWGELLKTAIAAGLGALLANIIAEGVRGYSRRSQAVEEARDEDLTSIIRMLDEIQELATAYWTRDAADLGSDEPVLRAKLMARQQHLLEVIAHLLSGDDKRDCDVLLTRLLPAFGGDDFGEPDRPSRPERLALVYQLSMSLAHTVRKARRTLPRGWLA